MMGIAGEKALAAKGTKDIKKTTTIMKVRMNTVLKLVE
jgi:hypothetical protein